MYDPISEEVERAISRLNLSYEISTQWVDIDTFEKCLSIRLHNSWEVVSEVHIPKSVLKGLLG